MRNLGSSDEPIHGRLQLAGILIATVFGLFAFRLFQLQIVEGAALLERSQRNSVRTVRLEAPRGEILDREGRVLATFRPAYELRVVPNDVQDPERIYRALGQLLEREPAELRARVGAARGAARFRPASLVSDLDPVSLARVESHAFAMPGVSTQTRPLRHYLEGPLAAHVFGTLGEIRPEQLEEPEYEDYRPGDVVGQTGLESRFEKVMRGHAGGRNVVVDAAGREVQDLERVEPLPGGRLVLALDLDLQRAAEAGFRDVPEGEPPQMGSAVAIDVRTGDVLAMASLPSYDPNAFAGAIDPKTWKELTSDEWKPLRNRAIQNHYPPGSTHKAVVAAAALQEGVITRDTRVFCPGSFYYGNRTFRCWKREGHGSVDVISALQRSCDVFFYTAGVKLGVDRLARHARTFGLGTRSGIDLEGESPGVVPSSDWKRAKLGQPWYPGETVSIAIGQGYNLYTPLQLALSYATIANGGRLLKPRLVLRSEDRDGVPETQFPVVELSRSTVSPENLAIVREGLTAVVETPGGTGGRARVPGVRVAGKTGTAQVVKLEHTEGMSEHEIPIKYRDHAWFGAFAPADAPEIAVGVFVEHGLHGASAAAPIAQRILAKYFEKKAASALMTAAAPAAMEAARAGDR
jgi:penicillin-binding protein 2